MVLVKIVFHCTAIAPHQDCLSLSQVLIKQPYASIFGIRTTSLEPWEQEVLESLKDQNRNQSGRLPTIESVGNSSIDQFAKIISNSLIFLKKASPLFYDEFEAYVAEIKLFNSDRLVGMTDPRVFGTVYICVPNADVTPDAYFCEHIIHETSHLHLNTLFAQDCLILNDFNERYAAPIRPDLRPMYGIFHATFVLSRMVRIFNQLVKFLENSSYRKCIEVFQRQFLNGYATIMHHAKLTRMGEQIVRSYSDLVELPG